MNGRMNRRGTTGRGTTHSTDGTGLKMKWEGGREGEEEELALAAKREIEEADCSNLFVLTGWLLLLILLLLFNALAIPFWMMVIHSSYHVSLSAWNRRTSFGSTTSKQYFLSIIPDLFTVLSSSFPTSSNSAFWSFFIHFPLVSSTSIHSNR